MEETVLRTAQLERLAVAGLILLQRAALAALQDTPFARTDSLCR